MMFLRGWITSIAVTMIFVVFVEILMPNSNMRKYIDFIIGLLVMMVILNPILKFAMGNSDMGDRILEVSGDMNKSSIQYQALKISKRQDNQVSGIYKNKLEKQIEKKIIDMGLVEYVKAEVQIDERNSSNQYGTISSIRITVAKKDKSVIEESIKKVNIKVNNNGSEEWSEELTHEDELLIEKISKYVEGLYDLYPGSVVVVFL